MAVSEAGTRLGSGSAARTLGARLGEHGLAVAIGLALAIVTTLPYLYAWSAQPPGRVFMGFFFLGDDANTYLAKMRQGWEGSWLWTNRYSTEPSPGAYFFTWWLALGHVAALLHLSLMAAFQAVRVGGAVALMAASWVFIRTFVEGAAARRFAIWFLAVGLGCGYLVAALHRPVLFGSQTDMLDWRMPELSAFYSILALPHFAWAAAFQAAGVVLTLRAAVARSLRLAVLAGLAWAAEASIHAQMLLLVGPAIGIALLVRPVGRRGLAAAATAFLVPLPYVAYSYLAYLGNPEVGRWSAQWRNNLPPDAPSLAVALLPQIALAALAVPAAIRRRSREDVVLLAWLGLLVAILWLPNPAGNLRRRFFDGIYLPLVVLAARGMFDVVIPRLRSLRARRLVPFAYVTGATISSAFLLLAPMGVARNPAYSVTTGEYSALEWLARQPAGVVLSSQRMGLYVPAYTPDTVYVGQYSETFDYRIKGVQAYDLLTGRQDVAGFVGPHHVRYVLWSDEYGGSPPLALGEPAFTVPGVAVYRLF
jgi:hypothetical protein